MQIVLISGFLGAGKTTLLQHLIAHADPPERTAIIVNEFGRTGIDGDLLRTRSMDIVEVAGGCLCCSLRGSLAGALDELLSLRGDRLDRIVIEASGVANVEEMVRAVREGASGRDWRTGPFVSVIDASRHAEHDRTLGEFLDHQIRLADVIVLNKSDLVSPDTIGGIVSRMKGLNPDALICPTERCLVDAELLLASPTTSPPARADQQTPSIRPQTATIALHTPCDSTRLKHAFDALPDSVWRAKGFLTLDGRNMLLQYASGRLEISATDVIANERLVLIGRNLDTEALGQVFEDIGEFPEVSLRPLRRDAPLFGLVGD